MLPVAAEPAISIFKAADAFSNSGDFLTVLLIIYSSWAHIGSALVTSKIKQKQYFNKANVVVFPPSNQKLPR